MIAKFLVPNDTKDIAIGKPMIVVVESEGDVPAFADYSPESSAGGGSGEAAGAPQPSSADAGSEAQPAASGPRSDRLGPAARMALANHGLSASDVTPTGPNGIVTKEDVLNAVASGAKPGKKRGAIPTTKADPSGLAPSPTKDADILPKPDHEGDLPRGGKSSGKSAAPSQRLGNNSGWGHERQRRRAGPHPAGPRAL